MTRLKKVCALAAGIVATVGSPSGVYAGTLLTGGQVDAAATIGVQLLRARALLRTHLEARP